MPRAFLLLSSVFTAGGAGLTADTNISTVLALPYVRKLLAHSACVREQAPRCPSRLSPNAPPGFTLASRSGAAGGPGEAICEYCSHGAYMVPRLIARYKATRIAEVGVCTGMTTVNVLAQQRQLGGTVPTLSRYYMVDPWGGRTCAPGCACARHLRKLGGMYEPLRALQGYSTAMAASVPNASLDLVFIDAAHDYANVRDDIRAYWPKLHARGVLAGHDFGHWRNWAQIRQDHGTAAASGRQFGGRGSKPLPPAYGVAQATQEFLGSCVVSVRYNVWWVEKESCSDL